MATKLGIINKALNYLGNPSVATLDNNDEVLVAMINLYETEKIDMLSSTAWSFAKKWALLVKTTEEPIATRWKYEYYLPNDYILAYQMDPQCDYEIVSGNKLHCNINSKLKMQYIYNVDEGLFPEYFTKLMAYTLAAESALLVTENVQLAEYWKQHMVSQKAIAQNRDFTAQPSPVVQNQNIWLEQF